MRGWRLRESTKTRVENGYYFGVKWLVMVHKLWDITNVQSGPFHNHFQLWSILDRKWMHFEAFTVSILIQCIRVLFQIGIFGYRIVSIHFYLELALG